MRISPRFKFPLWLQLLVPCIVVIGCALWAVRSSRTTIAAYTVNREYTDLRDESVARVVEIQELISRFRREAIRYGSPQVVAVESGDASGPPVEGERQSDVPLSRADLLWNFGLSDANDEPKCVFSGYAPIDSTGSLVIERLKSIPAPWSGPLESSRQILPRRWGQVSVPDAVAALKPVIGAQFGDALKAELLIVTTEPLYVQVTAHGTEPAKANEPPLDPVLWLAVRLPGARGMQAEQEGHALVAGLNLRDVSVFRTWPSSPRHLTFLTSWNNQNDPLNGKFLIHPFKNRENQARFAPADDELLGKGWLKEVVKAFPSKGNHAPRDDISDAARRGLLFPVQAREAREVSPGEGRITYVYQQTTDVLKDSPQFAGVGDAASSERGRQNRERLDQLLKTINAQFTKGDSVTAVGNFDLASGRIRIRARDDEELAQIRQRIAADLLSTFRIPPRDYEWEAVVRPKAYKIHLHKFRYDPAHAKIDEDDRYLYLAQVVAKEELEGEVIAEYGRNSRWIVACVVFAIVAAVMATTWIWLSLRRITRAAQSFSGAEPGSAAWNDTVARAIADLPVSNRDELGTLARAFRRMVDEIARGQALLIRERDGLDAEVRRQTASLETTIAELNVAKERAEAVNQQQNIFIATVSHELRTPLHHIRGFCQFLEESPLDEQQREDLAKIIAASHNLEQLINDILDYQRILRGGVTLELEEFPLRPLLDELAEATQVRADEKEQTVVVEADADLGTVTLDKLRLRQILNNLLSNAVKFTGTGGSVRLIARRLGVLDGERIELAVADTGQGMTPEQQSELFVPFKKLSDRRGNKDGTGLGLVISRGFCRRMGGDISYESEVGKGTTFTLRLPARLVDDASGAPSPPATAPEIPVYQPPAAGDRLVLVVDDDPNMRELMERYLGERGFRVESAASGEDGLQLAKQLRPTIITLDVLMPGMDGWETLAALKTNEQTAHIPVIMVSMIDNRSKGFALGVSDFLVKPLDWERLRVVLEKYSAPAGDREVLIVDDDPAHRHMLRRMLEKADLTAGEAENGQQALDRLHREPLPRMILLDLMMPVLDGFEFVEAVGRNPAWQSVPILVVTAKDLDQQERDRLNGRVDRILRKGATTYESILEYVYQRIMSEVAKRSHSA